MKKEIGILIFCQKEGDARTPNYDTSTEPLQYIPGGTPFTAFMKWGLDDKKNARQILGCHENALIQSFEKSPHLMGVADHSLSLL